MSSLESPAVRIVAELTRLARAELEAMAEHAAALDACRQELAGRGETVVSAALAGVAFEPWRHYPPSDVYDPATHAQYFFHSHSSGDRAAEHGHFHTFLRAGGMAPGMRPLVMPELAIADNPAAPAGPPVPSAPHASEDGDPWSHLIAIAMDGKGCPVRLFATNRWVTGETWYAAADVVAMLERFAIRPGADAGVVDRWITAMIGLFRPQIAALVQARDAAVMSWRRRRRAKVHVLEDRRLEIAAACPVDIDGQMRQIAAALRQVA